jgi:hypothetical protein
MDEFIKRVVKRYTENYITRDEMIDAIAKEYAKLWARGQILGQLGIE